MVRCKNYCVWAARGPGLPEEIPALGTGHLHQDGDKPRPYRGVSRLVGVSGPGPVRRGMVRHNPELGFLGRAMGTS